MISGLVEIIFRCRGTCSTSDLRLKKLTRTSFISQTSIIISFHCHDARGISCFTRAGSGAAFYASCLRAAVGRAEPADENICVFRVYERSTPSIGGGAGCGSAPYPQQPGHERLESRMGGAACDRRFGERDREARSAGACRSHGGVRLQRLFGAWLARKARHDGGCLCFF